MKSIDAKNITSETVESCRHDLSHPYVKPTTKIILISKVSLKFNDYLGKPLIYGHFQRIVG